MFIYILIISYLFNCFLIFNLLSQSVERENIAEMLLGNYSFEEIGAKVIKLAETSIPTSEFWHAVLENRSAANLSLEEWEVLKPLVPYLPHSDLRDVNFDNDHILEFFGKLQLDQTQLCLLAEMYSSKWGEDLYDNKERLEKIGNAFCGFSVQDLRKITTPVLKLLLNSEFFRNIKGCTMESLQFLCQRIQSYIIVGPPGTWNHTTIKMLGTIMAGMTGKDIRRIPSASLALMSPECIHFIPAHLLKCMTTKQLRRLPRPALYTWRRKTMDFRLLSSGSRIQFTVLLLVCVFSWT